MLDPSNEIGFKKAHSPLLLCHSFLVVVIGNEQVSLWHYILKHVTTFSLQLYHMQSVLARKRDIVKIIWHP